MLLEQVMANYTFPASMCGLAHCTKAEWWKRQVDGSPPLIELLTGFRNGVKDIRNCMVRGLRLQLFQPQIA